MMNPLSRKSFLRSSSRYLFAACAGFGAGIWNPAGRAAESPADGSWPWPYRELDPELVRKSAHDGFYQGGCGFGGFAAIVKGLQDKVGEPFTRLPLQLMNYAGGGVKGWGTICGALNGSCAAISLVCDSKTSGPIIDELILWYTQSPLPGAISNRLGETHAFGVDKDIPTLPQSVSGSPLCHVSTTEWCVRAGRAVDSPQRFERCARLSGDVAAAAVGLLNANLAGRFVSRHSLPEAASGCLGCHGAKGDLKNVEAKLDCVQCHKKDHP